MIISAFKSNEKASETCHTVNSVKTVMQPDRITKIIENYFKKLVCIYIDEQQIVLIFGVLQFNTSKKSDSVHLAIRISLVRIEQNEKHHFGKALIFDVKKTEKLSRRCLVYTSKIQKNAF